MKKTYLVESVGKTLLSEDRFLASKKTLSNSPDTFFQEAKFDLVLEKQGSSLRNTDDELYIEVGNISPPGLIDHRPNQIPVGGLRPSTVSLPFEVRYSFEDPTTQQKSWIGQDSYGVKTYEGFTFSSYDISEDLYISNPFMFEHNGELYFVCERRETVGLITSSVVSLYKRGEGVWFCEKRFSDYPVDVWDFQDPANLRQLQSGSPSGFSFNGHIYIAYRMLDRSSGQSKIMVFRDGELISDTVIADSPVNGTYSSYRLRFAQGSGMFMFVSYGVYWSGDIDEFFIPDFRTYVSFDGGYTLKAKTQSYRSVIRDKSIRFENTSALFNVMSDYDGISNQGYDTNFGLMFDSANSSFIVFKAGDSGTIGIADDFITSDGANYLVGIVASTKNPYDWDRLCKFKLEKANIGIGNYGLFADSGDPSDFDPAIPSTVESPLWIEDICPISNSSEQFLFLSFRGSNAEYNTCLVKIAIISSSRVPKGYAERVIAYGQKLHPDLIFLIDPINPSQAGFAHGGAPSALKEIVGGNKIVWKNLMGSFWRNQIAFTAQMTDISSEDSGAWASTYSPIMDRFVALAIAGRHSNLSEEFAYELSYPRYLKHPYGFNFEPVFNGGSWSLETDDYRKFVPGAGIGTYLNLMTGNSPNIAERASLSLNPLFKARFQCRLGGLAPTNQIEVFRWDVESAVSSTTRVVTVRMFVDQNGTVRFYNHDFVTTGPAFSIDLDESYDFSLIAEIKRDPILYASYKKTSDLLWNIVEVPLDFTAYTSGVTVKQVRLGCVSKAATTTGLYVAIGDIHLSSYSSGYRPILTRQDSINSGRRSEYVNGDLVLSNSGCRPIKIFSNKIPLLDGSIIAINNYRNTGPSTSRFKLVEARQRNSIKNVSVPNTAIGYNFSSVYNEDLNVEEMLFRIEDSMDFDSVSIINAAAIETVSFRTGKYDEITGTWLSFTDQTSSWPYEALTPLDYYQRILVVEDDVESHELEGRYLHVYDTDTNEYLSQILIIDNDGPFLTLESSLALGPETEIRLPYLSAHFDVNSIENSHMLISIEAIHQSDMFISNVEIGKLIELEDAVSDLDESYETTDKINTSDRGFSFNSYSEKTALSRKLQVQAPNMVIDSDYFNKVLDILTRNKQAKTPTVLILGEDKKDINYGFIEKIEVSPNGTEFDLDFDFCSATYNNLYPDYVAEQPDFYILVTEGNILEGEDFVLSAVTNYSDGVELSYLWDFGDGSQSASESPTHSYSATGEYLVSLTITDEYGNSSSQELTLSVKSPQIVDYELSATGPNPYDLVLTAKDRYGNTVLDSSTNLTFTYVFPTPAIPISPNPVRLTDGEAAVVIDSIPSTTTIYFRDSEGKNWYKEVTLT